MGYVRNPQPAVLNIEQARRRNAELRRELAALTVENGQLEAQVTTMRLHVSEARRKLTLQVRELEAARAQQAQLAQVTTEPSGLPEPVHGGREGLLAAAAEIKAHESAGALPKRLRGPSHGTKRRYAAGCRCPKCVAWRVAESERARVAQNARRARKRAA